MSEIKRLRPALPQEKETHSRYGGRGVLIYWHVERKSRVIHSQVINCTASEVAAMVEGAMHHGTEMDVEANYTDTHGLLNFALFDLCGLQLSPRIRDLGKITLYRTAPRAEVCGAYPLAGPLLTRRNNTQLIADNWDEMLRLAASLKYGHVTASLIVAKLSRADRQNTLAAALKEYGAYCRTVYAARYLSRPDYRRKIARQLNKGESTHALRRGIFYAHEGAIRHRHRPSGPLVVLSEDPTLPW
jgi:TnpA family transposase